MKGSVRILSALIFATILSLSVAPRATAADKESRVDGTLLSVNKEASTLTVRQRNNGQPRTVVYSGDTKFTKANGRKSEASTLDEVLKEGQRVIAVGKFNDKSQLAATQVSLREHP